MSVAQVPTLTEKGKINKDMLLMYPGLNEKLNSVVFSQSEQEKIKENVYSAFKYRTKRNSPQASSLSRSPMLKDKFQHYDVSFIFDEMETKKR